MDSRFDHVWSLDIHRCSPVHIVDPELSGHFHRPLLYHQSSIQICSHAQSEITLIDDRWRVDPQCPCVAASNPRLGSYVSILVQAGLEGGGSEASSCSSQSAIVRVIVLLQWDCTVERENSLFSDLLENNFLCSVSIKFFFSHQVTSNEKCFFLFLSFKVLLLICQSVKSTTN